MNPREDDPEFAQRRPTFEDLRADYDDEFGRSQSPFEVARRRLAGPAIAHIVIGILGVIGFLALTVGVVGEHIDKALNDEVKALFLILMVGASLLGAGLFALVIVAGMSKWQLRRRGLCLCVAYFVTGLSLAGCYALLFYPFGIWALVVLHRPDVREQFGRRPQPQAQPGRDW
jgi:hypothetical protein